MQWLLSNLAVLGVRTACVAPLSTGKGVSGVHCSGGTAWRLLSQLEVDWPLFCYRATQPLGLASCLSCPAAGRSLSGSAGSPVSSGFERCNLEGLILTLMLINSHVFCFALSASSPAQVSGFPQRQACQCCCRDQLAFTAAVKGGTPVLFALLPAGLWNRAGRHACARVRVPWLWSTQQSLCFLHG